MTMKWGICTYCGETRWVEPDHVPPRNLFPKPYPANMWTVPACRNCNGGFSLDDEYFRIWLTIADRAKGQHSREKILPSVIRGLLRDENGRLRHSLYKSSAFLPRFAPSGLYLGHRPAIDFDGSRIGRVVERVIKGLFFRVNGRCLSDDYVVHVSHASQLGPVYLARQEVRRLIDAVEAQPARKLADSFAFKYLQLPNGPNQTVWLLYFFGHEDFLCTTRLAPASQWLAPT
jgi:hypothetical protein